MTIRMSEVKTLCTPSEQSLVAASRKPQLQSLDATALRSNAQRARKLLEKWQHQGRSQARTRSQRAGLGEEAARTRRKAEIFAEALASFQARLQTLETAERGAASGRKKPKTIRARENRATRADVRKRLSKKQKAINREEGERIKARAAKAPPPPQPEAGRPAAGHEGPPESTAADAPAKRRKPRAALPPPAKPLTKRRSEQLGLQEQTPLRPSNQKATTAAKQARITRSGLTTRVRGHVSARGRRVQGRRDQRNS